MHTHTPTRRYAADQRWLNKKHIIGRAVGYLPYVGMVTIIMNDYPYLKYALIGLLGIFVLTSRE
jgi:signal peptidase